MHKTVMNWDSIRLVYGRGHATGDAAKTPVDGAKEMSNKEDGTSKELTSSSTSASLKRQHVEL